MYRPTFRYPTYPPRSQPRKKAPAVPNVFAQFKTTDGNYDLGKMIHTANAVVHTVGQIHGMVKQVGGVWKKPSQ